MKELRELLSVGQITEDDMLYISGARGNFVAPVIPIPNQGTEKEEIVINKKYNHYFILEMYFKGKSWVKKAYIIPDCKPYKKRYWKDN